MAANQSLHHTLAIICSKHKLIIKGIMILHGFGQGASCTNSYDANRKHKLFVQVIACDMGKKLHGK